MKIEKNLNSYVLKASSIDEISEQIEGFLKSIDTERSNVIRIRFTLEESLLRWRDHFGEDAIVTVATGAVLGRPYIRISLKGEPYDPLNNSENDLGDWADSLMRDIGLDPTYAYITNTNVVTLKLPKPVGKPARRLVLSILFGILIGVVTKAVLPFATRETIVSSYLGPVQDVFFRMLNVAAIPILFLSVLAAACGAGTAAARGKQNRKMILHFILLNTILTFMAAFIAIPVFGLSAAPKGYSLITIFHAVITIIPTDIMTPFQEGNSPQLILIALVLGNALLAVGSQASELVKIIDQSYHVVLIIADWVSRITPLFVVILLVLGIWDKSPLSVLMLWKPVVLFLVTTLLILAAAFILVSVTKKVSVTKLMNKVKRSFWIALKDSSVNTAYGENSRCCTDLLGIDKRLADYAIPLGLVLFMPVAAMGTVIFTLYAASTYGVETSIMWIAATAVLAVALQTATPPVAGVDLLAYAAIFSRMGIPREALILAMVADILFSFLTSAADQAILQMGLVIEADRSGQLNKELLRR